MNATRLLLGLVSLAAIAGAVLLLRSNPAHGSEGGIAPVSRVTPPSRARDAATPPAVDAPELQSGPPIAATPARTEVGPAAAAPARTLRVTVTAPDGAPADPELSVVAVSANLLGGNSPAALLERLRLDGDPAVGFARASVDGSGVAQLQLPTDLAEPLVMVDGRFLYVTEPRRAEQNTRELSVEPELGGLVQIHLQLPAGEAPSGELRLMGGDWSGGAGGWRNREQSILDTDLLEFRGVDPGLTWTLMPALAEHHADMRMGFEVVAGRELRIDVEVTPGATVRGEVVDGEGAPMAGVEVAAGGGMPWMGGGDSRRVETGADGRFALRGLAPGRVEISAELEGWLDAESSELELGDGEVFEGMRLVLERGRSIAGLVQTPDAQPVAGARVVVERLQRQTWGGWGGGSRLSREGRATTDAEGRFAVSGLEEGRFTVRAAREDVLTQVTSRALLEGVEAGGPDVVLELREPITFAGRVVDDIDQPVTAFRIEVESVEQGGPEEQQRFEDPEGRFGFARVGPGEWQVRVEAEGHVQAGEVELALPGDGGELILRLQRTARVEGQVLDPTGAPIAGASVRAGDGSAASGFGGWGRPAGPRAESDAEGRFALEDLAPGSLELTARAEGWADSEPAAFELVPDQLRQEVVLALRVGGRIEGQVLTSEGDAVPGQRVTWGANAMGFGSRGETETDSGGRFVFERVTPGEWAVSAVPSFDEFSEGMRGGGQSAFVEIMGNLVTKTVTVEDGQLVEVFLGGEPRQPVRIFGTVSRAGEPLAGAAIFAVSEGSAVFEGMKSARADSDGSYELVLDRPGPHTLSASAGDVGVEQVVEVPRQEELRVDLAIPLGRIEGRVSEPDGSPAAGVRLALEREDGLGRIRWAGGQETTDEDGRYAFEDLQAGSYSVRANVASWGGGANERFGATVRGGIAVAENQATSGIDFELQSAGTIAGLVVGQGGAPVQGAALYFRDAGGRLVSQVSSVTTNAAGRFEKAGLAPGEYTVSSRAETLAAGDEVSVRVTSGETSEVEVVLEQGATVLVRLEDENGEARRARVQVLDDDGRDVGNLMTMQAMMATFNEGASILEQRLGPIPPGRYTVRATTADGQTEERRVRLRAQDTDKRVVLKLDG